MTLSAGSASYGNQTAAAAPEVVSRPVSSAKIVTSHSRSARTTPQVSPETPAPMMAARFRTRSGFHQQDGGAIELSLAQPRQRFVRLRQRKRFCFGFYRDAWRNFQKLFAIAPSEVCDRANRTFAPEIAIGKCGNVAHVNAGGNYDAAFIEMPQCERQERANRCENDRSIQFFGRRFI